MNLPGRQLLESVESSEYAKSWFLFVAIVVARFWES